MTDVKTYVLYDGAEGAPAADPAPAPAPAPATPPADPPQLPEGTFRVDDFKSVIGALPEDLRNNASLTRYNSLEAFARGHLSQAKMVGDRDMTKFAELPLGPDDAEGHRRVLQKLGLPDTPDAYELKPGDKTPAYMTPEGELAKGFVTKAHEMGILPSQAQGVFSWFGEQMAAVQTAAEEQQAIADKTNREALDKLWGKAATKMEAAANFAAEKLWGADAAAVNERITAAGLGVDPQFMNGLAKVGLMMAEDGAGDVKLGEGMPDFGTGLTPAEATARAKELQRQALDPKLKGNFAEQRRLNDEAQKFWKIAIPENRVA